VCQRRRRALIPEREQSVSARKPEADAGVAKNMTSMGPTEAQSSDHEVTELRLVVTAADYDEALHLYRDVLGLREIGAFSSAGGRVTILAAGRATLELANPKHAEFVNDVEVGRRMASHMRVAFAVRDCDSPTDALGRATASVIAPPTRTPWNSLNSRLVGAAGLQLTLFSAIA